MENGIKEDYEKWEDIYKNASDTMIINLLMDVIAHMAEFDDEGKIQHDRFDKAVDSVKGVLKNLTPASIEGIKNKEALKNNLKQDVESAEQVEKEALYSMRTLSWVLDLIESEKGDE